MKLKTKRLLAAALAMSLTANISLAAFAGTYDLADGSITIDGGDSAEADTTVQVGSNGAVVDNEEITIIQTNSEEEATNNTITIEGNVDNSVTIEDVNIVVDENSTTDAAITIEDNSVVDITLSGDNDITLDAGGTSGIEVGAGAEVTITVDGTTDISTTYTDDAQTAASSDSLLNVDDAGNLTTGISVGGGAVDDALDGNGASLTITGTEDSDDALNISGTSTGILVHGNSSLTIGDVDEDDLNETIKVSIEDATRTYDGWEGSHVKKDDSGNTVTDDAGEPIIEDNAEGEMYYTVSGKGIMSWGNVTITKGAELEINDSDLQGININEADLTISEGAKVTITNSGTNDSISDAAKEAGDSQSYAGIYAQNGKSDQSTITVKGDGTSLTITGSTGDGIAAEAYDVNVADGASLTISDVAKKDATAGMNITGGGDVTISGAGTVVDVSGTGGEGGIHLQGTDDNSADLTVTDSAKLNISNTLKSGITANGNSNITMSNNAVVYMTVINGYPIYMLGGSGNAEYNLLEVTSGAELTIADWTYDGGIMYYDNKHVLISDGAIVTLGSGTNGVHLLGNNTSLIVDNAELISGSRIVIENGNETIEIKPHIEVRNGSRVVVPYVINYSTAAEFWITGGTVELTEDKTSGTGWVGNSDSENLLTMLSKDFWPTSGEENGDEKLTGFKLSVSALETLQADLWAEDEDLSEEEFFEKYGFLIEYEDGVPTTLTFQTYGVVDGEYYSYNENKDNGTESNWYVVDLTKGYDDELWVWTPAVVLSYFSLVDGNKLSDAESSDESNPNDVSVGDKLTNYHDVVVRGQSIAFGNFQTNSDYTTTDDLEDTAYAIAKAAAKEKGIVLYIYDAMDEGADAVPADSISEDDVIIVKGDGDKFYLADEDGNASETVVGTYYYALIDDEGNFILDDDGNFIWYDEDGVAYTAESDGVALIAVLDSGTSYVLYVDGEYYRVNSNGECTTVVAGEAIPVGSLWSVFDEYTRVRSNAQANNETYNFENVFGGVATTATEIEPQEPEEDEETTPTDPTDPNDPDPTVPVPVPVVPVTPDTPAQPETPTETPEETPAETPADPEAPAETPETPASSTPKTGDEANVAIYLVMAALSGAALIGLGVTGRKKNEEV